MNLLLKRALDQASVWHQAQLRKYPNVSVPYISHLAGVATILTTHGFDEEVVAAGALHDAMEDCGISHTELENIFGTRVANLVQLTSEPDKSLSWDVRKKQYIESFAHKPWDAQAIMVADKIDNFYSIVACAQYHGDPWIMFRRGKDIQLDMFARFNEKLQLLPPHSILNEFNEAFYLIKTS